MGNSLGTSYQNMQACEHCGGALTLANAQTQCRRCHRVMCKRCFGGGLLALLPCPLTCTPCNGCKAELSHLETFKRTLLPVLTAGARFSVSQGLFRKSEDVLLMYDARKHVLTWNSLRMQRQKAVVQGSLPLRELGPATKQGSDLTLCNDRDERIVTLTADKAVTAETWEHAVDELRVLRQALMGRPSEDTARLANVATHANAEAKATALLSKRSQASRKANTRAAKSKLDRLMADAKERKAKYAGTGLTHVAAAMAARGSKK